ncbi:MAG: hypothetical protein LBS57_04940 [Treponema sp.]|jgi:hypothetical protein|nr:hypothetical protein [Treponema sp.]
MKKQGIIAGGIAALTVLFALIFLGCGGGSESRDSYSSDAESGETTAEVNTDLEPEYFFGEWMMPSEVGIVGTVAISQDKYRWDNPLDENYQEMAVENWEPAAIGDNWKEYFSGGFTLTGKTKSNVADLRVNEITVYLSNDGQSIMFLDEDDFPTYYEKKTAQSTAELEARLVQIQQEVEQTRKELANAASRQEFLEKAKQKAGGWFQKGKGLLGRAKDALGGLLEEDSGIVDKTGGAIEITASYAGDSGGTLFIYQNTTDEDLAVHFEPFYANGLPIGNSLLGADFNVLTAKAGATDAYVVLNASPDEIGKLVISLK